MTRPHPFRVSLFCVPRERRSSIDFEMGCVINRIDVGTSPQQSCGRSSDEGNSPLLVFSPPAAELRELLGLCISLTVLV